jgi:sugar/nucleoside kinase (ribokinase family)
VGQTFTFFRRRARRRSRDGIACTFSRYRFLGGVTGKKRKKVRIGVVGTINRDIIHRADGSRTEGYGGILFNLRVLWQLFGNAAVIIPAVNVGTNHADRIRHELQQLESVDTSAVRVVPGANNHCTLRYYDHSEKSEVLRGRVGAVSRAQLARLIHSDLILVNFISGADITSRNLIWLRREYKGLIYMDLHSRTLALRRDGSRRLRVPPFWKEYVDTADFLQLNEIEFRLLHGDSPNARSCADFFLHYLPGCRAMMVTVGGRGCLLTQRRGRTAHCLEIRPRLQRKVIDTTGCGDVFAGGFVYAHLSGASHSEAVQTATELASYAAARPGIGSMDFTRVRPLPTASGSGNVQ